MRTPRPSLLSPLLLAAGLALSGGCVADETELALHEQAESVWQWEDPIDLSPHDTTRQVALAPLGSYLYMVYTDSSSSTSTLLKWSRWDGTTWRSESSSIGQSTNARPALAAHEGQLHLVYKPASEGRLMMTTSPTGVTWSSPVTVGRSLGGYTPYNPHLLSHGDRLYLSYCVSNGTSSYVHVDRWNGTSWTAFHTQLASAYRQYACNSALLAPMPDTGEVELVYNVNTTTSTAYSAVLRKRAVLGRSTTVWYEAESLPMKSYKPLSVVTCDGQTHLVHGGYSNPNEIWWSFRENDDWTINLRVPDQSSSGGAALGCLNGTTTVMVHNDGSTNLQASVFGP